MTSYQPSQSPYQPAPGAVVPPLWAPYYGASLPIAFRRFWKKYSTFSGRASRSEYWWWALIQGAIGIIFEIVAIASFAVSYRSDGSTPEPAAWNLILFIPLVIWSLATVVPSLALTWRRLHDANYSGGYYFLGLIPYAGGIILLVFTLLPPKPEGARFDRPDASPSTVQWTVGQEPNN